VDSALFESQDCGYFCVLGLNLLTLDSVVRHSVYLGPFLNRLLFRSCLLYVKLFEIYEFGNALNFYSLLLDPYVV